jgi:hypothetical protein
VARVFLPRREIVRGFGYNRPRVTGGGNRTLRAEAKVDWKTIKKTKKRLPQPEHCEHGCPIATLD